MVVQNNNYRNVAQLGRALRSGRRGRVFESRHSDSLAGACKPLFLYLKFNRNGASAMKKHFTVREVLFRVRLISDAVHP